MKPQLPHNYKKMTFKKTTYLFILAGALLLSGCVSSKKLLYFQENEQIKLTDSLVNFEPALQPGDLITINVSANDPVSGQTFNLYEANIHNNLPRMLPYLVDSEGQINFPVLGKLQAGGYTTQQVGNNITEALNAYLVAPIVNVRLTNFKITVMGEVQKPGTYAVPNERLTIVEALGLAGDLNIQAKRNDITLIREHEGKRVFYEVDLTNKALFNAPYYYLAQNDVLYVEPNKTKINSSAVGASTSVILSSIGILISLITLFSL